MSLFSNLLMLLIGYSGILFGIALSYIAPEELFSGKRYFMLLRMVLYLILNIIIIYFSWSMNDLFGILILLILIAGSIFVYKLPHKSYSWWGLYLIFTLCYFLIPIPNFQILATIITFLYGLPLGTLLRTS